MGILMIVAIPAVSRTIDNSRKDVFVDTAKQYVSAVKTAWISDGFDCRYYNGSTYITNKVPSEVPVSTLYAYFSTYSSDSSSNHSKDLLESGGKSPWGNKDVYGYVKIYVTGTDASKKATFSVYMTDGTHSVGTPDSLISYDQLKRKSVAGTSYSKSAFDHRAQGYDSAYYNSCVLA